LLNIKERSELKSKILSYDHEDGSSTCIIKYPPGWHRDSTEYVLTDEEFYVLEGEISINNISYEVDTYAHLPSGFQRDNVISKNGAVLLTFFGGSLNINKYKENHSYDKKRLVLKTSAKDAEWNNVDLDALGLKEISSGSRLLSLFVDPLNSEITYLTGSVPFKAAQFPERHPVAQEFYVLGGVLAGNCGIMQAGAYCWRPPMVIHGPYGSPTGALILLRSIGGPLTTEIFPAVEHSYKPEHKPVLPSNLLEVGKIGIDLPKRY
jgi:hypothetical protein